MARPFNVRDSWNPSSKAKGGGQDHKTTANTPWLSLGARGPPDQRPLHWPRVVPAGDPSDPTITAVQSITAEVWRATPRSRTQGLRETTTDVRFDDASTTRRLHTIQTPPRRLLAVNQTLPGQLEHCAALDIYPSLSLSPLLFYLSLPAPSSLFSEATSSTAIFQEGGVFGMSDHIVLREDKLLKPTPLESMPLLEAPESSMEIGAVHDSAASGILPSIGHSVSDERNVEIAIHEDEEPLIQSVECRICQEEDDIKHLDTPCACSGSLKVSIKVCYHPAFSYAHRACLQRWVNEKGDLTCEICHEPYKPGGGWTISGNPFNLHDPRVLAMAAAHHHFLEADYDEYAATNASGAAFCRSAALILMALLLLRYALTITNGEGEDDPSTFFSVSEIESLLLSWLDLFFVLCICFLPNNYLTQLFLLRAAGFLLPCYIMAWAISILQRRRQRQEAAELAAAEVAFILQSGQARGVQFTIEPESPATPQQEPHQ
ncbi:hypothetical protein Taro_054185 [Colocasia esculenta]|uniref:RING-CH-type domain-containing protein n=1 Tax=Colocasia esculenta TaxID=4460 RepID=A0A843XPU4_COLES|nr:hypothetical protein [Colocasia esculenta]